MQTDHGQMKDDRPDRDPSTPNGEDLHQLREVHKDMTMGSLVHRVLQLPLNLGDLHMEDSLGGQGQMVSGERHHHGRGLVHRPLRQEVRILLWLMDEGNAPWDSPEDVEETSP